VTNPYIRGTTIPSHGRQAPQPQCAILAFFTDNAMAFNLRPSEEEWIAFLTIFN